MSSVYPCSGGYCFPGSKAVDGVYREHVNSAEYFSIAVTTLEQNPYLQIDLGESHCIKAVKLWNRGSTTREYKSQVYAETSKLLFDMLIFKNNFFYTKKLNGSCISLAYHSHEILKAA